MVLDSGATGGTAAHRRFLPYLIAFAALVAALCIYEPFWRTNDDVSMMLISRGNGIAAYASPRLVLVNIAWGYLVHWFPDIGGIYSYTWLTYLALGISYATVLWCLVRSQVPHVLAAILITLVYLPALILPQFTLVAGQLAVAGLILLCCSLAAGRLRQGCLAALLLVLSSLVRADETVLVVLVSAPLAYPYLQQAWASGQRRQWIMLAAAAFLVFAGFQLLDYLTFSSGGWQQFAGTYAVRTELTDFRAGAHFVSHPHLLAGSGYSMNDLYLFSKWFYNDDNVFSVEKVNALLQRLSWHEAMRANFNDWRSLLKVLESHEIEPLLAAVPLVLLFHRRRLHFLGALLVFALAIFALVLLGRPGISHIYVPVLALLLLMGLLECRIEKPLVTGLAALAALAIAAPFLWKMHITNEEMRYRSQQVQAATCALDDDHFFIIWGADYPFSADSPPFRHVGAGCPLNYYSFGEFSLAPFALARLHAVTGGRDFVPAVLAGQSFKIIADENLLQPLQEYFRAHYSVTLTVTPDTSIHGLKVFTIGMRPAASPR